MEAASVLTSKPGMARLQVFALFVNFFFPAVALIIVSTRAAGRLAIRQFGWDDWLVCIAMLMSVAETVISYFCMCTPLGLGVYLDAPANSQQLSRQISLASPSIKYRPTTPPRA